MGTRARERDARSQQGRGRRPPDQRGQLPGGVRTDISQCTYQVTPENVGQNLTAHADVDVTNNQRVFVSLRNAANAVRTDGNFQLALFC